MSVVSFSCAGLSWIEVQVDHVEFLLTRFQEFEVQLPVGNIPIGSPNVILSRVGISMQRAHTCELLQLLNRLQMAQTLQVLVGVNYLDDVAALSLHPVRGAILKQNRRRLFSWTVISLRRQLDFLDLPWFQRQILR